MKKSMMALLAAGMLFAACQDKEAKKFSFNWKTDLFEQNGVTFDSLKVYDEEGNILPVTTAISTDSLYFEGELEEAIMAKLTLYMKTQGEPDSNDVEVILEPGANLVVDVMKGLVTGGAQNDSVNAFTEKFYEMYEHTEQRDSLVRQFVTNNLNTIAGMTALATCASHKVSPSLLQELWDKFSPEFQKRKSMQNTKQTLDVSAKSAEGQPFVDFEAEYDGKVQKLSDYVGKGKYVLVDFWASWCGPCRGEIPNIKAVYEKYAGENFEVLGVATWDKPEDTMKAIEEEGVTYPQIINAEKAGSDAYGIQGIPEIILFGPDGTILKRGLRGEQIEQEVSKALGQ